MIIDTPRVLDKSCRNGQLGGGTPKKFQRIFPGGKIRDGFILDFVDLICILGVLVLEV